MTEQRVDAVVLGGGAAGLVAARRLALGNRETVLLEASERLGGRVGVHEVAGIALDSGAESFAVRGGAVAELLDVLGLRADVEDPIQGGAWLALPGRTVPLPEGGVLGIPPMPLAADVLRVLGSRAAWRAYLDRMLPVVKVGRYADLGALVRGRMGSAVLDLLVRPVVQSVYGRDPDGLPVAAVAPGLNAAITQTGSLSTAVTRLRASAPAGSAVQGIAGGVHRLVAALAADLERFGVDVRLGAAATSLEEADDGWIVGVGDARIRAQRVVVAVDGAAAWRLLEGVIPALAGRRLPDVAVSRLATLVVDDARLDARPRGSGVLRAASTPGVRATALTHSTAKWAWLRDSLPPGRHVVRLSYRGDAPVDAATARADASALLGVDLGEPAGFDEVVWRDAAPALAAETLDRRPLAAAPPVGIAIAGSWLHGTGLASVVAGADAAARSLLP